MSEYSLTIRGSAIYLASVLGMLGAGGQPVPLAIGGEPDDDGEIAGSTLPAPASGVDSAGLPWDGRIHSSSKKVKGDGTWNRRKGVADALVAQVEAELRARVGTPMQQPAPMMPPMAQPPVMAPPQMPASTMPPMAQPPVMTAPVPAPIPAPVPQPPAAIDFNTVMQKVQQGTAIMGANGQAVITMEYLNDLAARTAAAWQIQLPGGFTDLAQPHFAQVVEWVAATMQAEGRWIA